MLFRSFKAAMQDRAMTGAHKFNFGYKTSDSARNVVVYTERLRGCVGGSEGGREEGDRVDGLTQLDL